MIIISFFYGLFFCGLGLAAYLQLRTGGEFPLRRELPWLAAFGFLYGTVGWIEMFQYSGDSASLGNIFNIFRIILQSVSGLVLLIFGWRILTQLTALPSWAVFIPGLLLLPVAFVITYAATTFFTPSPIAIPVDIWSRYLLYLPGSIMAGIGFLRQWKVQQRLGYPDVASMMLGAGLAFLFEAFIVGLVVPAAPYGPASYYNYDRNAYNAFIGKDVADLRFFGLMSWLDYQQVLEVTGLPVQFWRLLSAIILTMFVVRGLGVFEAIRKRQVLTLQRERDRAQQAALQAQIIERQAAESWTEALVSFGRRIAELEDTDKILLYILEKARVLLRSSYMAIAIWDAESSSLRLKYYSNQNDTGLITTVVPVENPLVLDTLKTGQPNITQENETAGKLVGVAFREDQPARSVAITPLAFDNNPIGVLWIARTDDVTYTETEFIWLECISDQIVIAMQHGIMMSQLQSLSVIEERARIAREMHDGLAQILGYLNLQVQTLDALLSKEKWDTLRAELKRMRSAIQQAHADVRENILSLRTTLAYETGLIPAVIEYVEEFGIQNGIKTLFMNHVGEELDIPSFAEVQLVCILQEMLANVRKHAHANQVIVHLAKEERGELCYIHLAVIDDGVGFIPGESKRSFGLQTMQERAQSVSGKVMMFSKPGEGTRVECLFPCIREEGLSKSSRLAATEQDVAARVVEHQESMELQQS